MTAARTAVVHLVREANGLAPYEAFMSSYERHPAEHDHDLVLLFKGFGDAAGREPYIARAAAHEPQTLDVSDSGLDLTAYLAATAALEYEQLCFVNSFSEILAPGWLRLLATALEDGDCRSAAGATGSWNSQLSYRLYQLGLGGRYARAFASRRAANRAMHELSGTPLPGDVRNWLFTLMQTARHSRAMTLFPAVHLRTNAFLIDRLLLASLDTGGTWTKWGAYELESGRRSITRQLIALGRPPVVVDREGVARAPADWHRGDVFWQAAQQDLLVGDNRTRGYDAATASQRAVLSAMAWGSHARPG